MVYLSTKKRHLGIFFVFEHVSPSQVFKGSFLSRQGPHCRYFGTSDNKSCFVLSHYRCALTAPTEPPKDALGLFYSTPASNVNIQL